MAYIERLRCWLRGHPLGVLIWDRGYEVVRDPSTPTYRKRVRWFHTRRCLCGSVQRTIWTPWRAI